MALGVFIGAFVAILVKGILTTGGRFVYAVDDAYIHLAIAENFADHGVWGPSDSGFASASSSPGWTLALALLHLVAPLRDWFPLLLSTGAALVAILVAHRMLLENGVTPWIRGVALVAAIWFTPLVPLVFTGLEHPAQIAVDLALLHAATRSLRNPNDGRATKWMIALAPATTAIRYEGAALVFVVALMLIIRRRHRDAVMIAALAALPIALIGIISMYNGGFFLPNSIVMKTLALQEMSPFFRLFVAPVWALFSTPHVLGLAALSAATAIFRRGHAADAATIFSVTAFLHFAYGSTGWFYRYEAYLVFVGVIVAANALHDLFPARWTDVRHLGTQRIGLVALLILLVGMPLEVRAEAAHEAVAPAMENIHDQQVQVGDFLHEYYTGESVILNDIGATNFFADIRCLDMWGLGSNDVARLRATGYLDVNDTRRLARSHNASIAIVFERAFEIPPEWTPVGSWTLKRVTVAGSARVTFFAVDPAAAEVLRENLKDFSPRLPDRVLQNAMFVQ